MDVYYVVSIKRNRPDKGETDTVFSVHVTEAGAAVVQEAIMGAMLNPPKPAEKIVVR